MRNGLQDSSGGKFEHFILKEFGGRIVYSTFQTIDMMMGQISKLPTTTVLKPILGAVFRFELD